MKKLLPWIMVLVMITVVFGSVYGVVQQAQRSDANSPQIQMSEDIAAKLDDKADPHVLLTEQVDITKSLKPFTVIYDKKGEAVAASGYLDQKMPNIDKSILDNSKDKDYSAVTWKPTKDTRFAAVVIEAKDYYVLSGRSLKEVEKNENTSFQLSVLGWMVSVILLGGLFVAYARSEDR